MHLKLCTDNVTKQQCNKKFINTSALVLLTLGVSYNRKEVQQTNQLLASIEINKTQNKKVPESVWGKSTEEDSE